MTKNKKEKPNCEYIVSACLAGRACRYDGSAKPNERVMRLVREGRAVMACPEMLAGFGCPRLSVEIVEEEGKRRAVQTDGVDVTEKFRAGAARAAQIAREKKCKKAILKSGSPSCGYGEIYDGSFTGKKRAGNGFLAEELVKMGVEVETEKSGGN